MVSLENFSLKVFPKWDKMPSIESIEHRGDYQVVKIDPRGNKDLEGCRNVLVVVPGGATPYEIDMAIKTSFQILKKGALLN